MGKITKIMLGLNIVAGIIGIVFGMGVKGDLKKANTAKEEAEASAAQIENGTSSLKSDKTKLQEELGLVKGEIESLSNRLVAASSNLGDAQKQETEAVAALKVAQTEAAKLQSKLAEVTGLAQEHTKLKTTLADYQALGTVEEVRDWKKKATRPKPTKPGENGPNKPKPPKPQPTAGAEIGNIVSFDKKFGFYVINRGTDHGVKNGDEFKVVRAGNLVGKIKIADAQPSVSIAEPIKELTRQQLQPGDILRK